MRSGDFSGSRARSATRSPASLFPNNQIPTSLFSPAAVKIVNEWLPLPNPWGLDNPLTARFASRRTTTIISGSPAWITASRQAPRYGAVLGLACLHAAVLLDGNILSSAFGRTWQNTVASINDTYILTPTC